jgi:hypothetical protein
MQTFGSCENYMRAYKGFEDFLGIWEKALWSEDAQECDVYPMTLIALNSPQQRLYKIAIGNLFYLPHRSTNDK